MGGAGQTALRLGDEARRTTALSQAEADAGKSARLQQADKLYDQAAALLRNAIARADEFVTGLGIADAKGVLLITKLAQENVCLRRVDGERYSGSGSGYARYCRRVLHQKELWTFLRRIYLLCNGRRSRNLLSYSTAIAGFWRRSRSDPQRLRRRRIGYPAL